MPIASEKQQLMRRLMACSFTLTEAQLYLDSHPTCRQGLEYWRRHKEEYDKVKKEYEERFGPITVMDYTPDKKWAWATEPFPWERGES